MNKKQKFKFINLVWELIKQFSKKWSGFLTLLAFILSIIAILPYGLEIYYYIHYKPSVTLLFNVKKLSQDKDGNWLADYNLSITSNMYFVLPKKIFIAYDSHVITSNAQPSSPGGSISGIPVKNAKTLAHVWDFDDVDGIQNCIIQPHHWIGIFPRAWLGKQKITSLPTQIVIYAEVDPADLGFLRLFYHNRLYKGTIYHVIDFTGTKEKEEISIRLN